MFGSLSLAFPNPPSPRGRLVVEGSMSFFAVSIRILAPPLIVF